jgi:epoxyqueuosine reductase QueG
MSKQIDRIVRTTGVDLWRAASNSPSLPLAPELPTAISLVMRLAPGSLEGVTSETGPDETYYREWCRANDLLDATGEQVVEALRAAGHEAQLVPTTPHRGTVEDWGAAGVFPHKTAATQAGLGWIGKTALFVSPLFGPKVRLATIFTDARLPLGEPVVESRCAKCRLCVDACPAGAGRDVLWHSGMPRDELYEEKACESYTERFRTKLPDAVCAICVVACPFGKKESGRRRRGASSRPFTAPLR